VTVPIQALSVQVEPVQVGTQQSALLRAVEVMDRLRSPGGCPWDAEQTHDSLRRYLVEECYELLEALEDGDAAAIREELGDVLLQVLFHARIAAERDRGSGGFDIDDVAAGLVDKLVRRHPHVFAETDDAAVEDVGTAADQQLRWDELKKTEHGRTSVVAGVALGQPAVALAAKLGARAARAGLHVQPPDGDSTAERLFRIAYEAGVAGADPESELRAVAKDFAGRLSVAEATQASTGPALTSADEDEVG